MKTKNVKLLLMVDLTRNDLKRHLKFGFNDDQVEQLMNNYDTNKDGRLYFLDFVKMVLPSNYSTVKIRRKHESEGNLMPKHTVH